MKANTSTYAAVLTALAAAGAWAGLAGTPEASAGEWYRWRGPNQNGVSEETGLPEKWDPATGENVVWKARVGGMSSPIVMRGKLYTITRTGEAPAPNTVVPSPGTQEAVIALDAETGKEVWRHTENLFQTRVPFHRLGWANPAGDPATGRVYVLGVQCTMQCLEGDTGAVVWKRQLTEEFGMISTFGGRTNTPVVDEDQVIISGVCFGWADQARGQYRLLAFDKATGRLNWSGATGGIPVDAPFNTPVVAVIDGVRQVICAAGDGGIHSFKVRTGEKLWTFQASKRGMNASVVVEGSRVFICQCEENVDSQALGRVCCIDVAGCAAGGKPKEVWRIDGIEAGFGSPTLVGGRLYVVDNGAKLFSIDSQDGKVYWNKKLGTIGKASLVHADGKIYLPEANGRFYILRPGETKVDILSKVELPEKLAREYAVFGSVAISDGRVYLQCANSMYCIGGKEPRKSPTVVPGLPKEGESAAPPKGGLVLQVVPADALLRPGEKVKFEMRVFDAYGRPTALSPAPTPAMWSVGQLTLATPAGEKVQVGNLKGTVAEDGTFTAVAGPPQGGAVVVKVGDLVGHARVRVLPPPPFEVKLDAAPVGKPPLTWIGAGGKFAVEEHGGKKVLAKLTENPLYDSAWTYFGPPDSADYTIQADTMAKAKEIAGTRQQADSGVVNSRYALVLLGNHQRLQLNVWPPTLPNSLNKTIDFKWEPDTWYRMKLEVRQAGGKALVKGKVWKADAPEPAEWTVEMEDALPNTTGAPGLFAFSNKSQPAYFDNIKVTPNGK
jgi:outer membrane protein assembly factor BamB